MAAAVTAIACPANEWTLISDGNASVLFMWRSETGYGKWYIGQTDPDVDTLNYATLRPKQPGGGNDLSPGDKIWAMPFGTANLIMEVLTP